MTTALTKEVQDNVWGLLQSLKGQIALAAPRHLTPDRILRIAMTSIQRTPKLAQCSQPSLLGSVLTCTQLGLEPDAASGKAYLIPYGDVCTLIIGYRGLMELARRSGEILSIEARIVYAKDLFEYAYGTDAHCKHVPSQDAESPGKMVAVYAVATFRQGGFQFEVMTRAQIDAVKSKSQATARGTPWAEYYDEMARKTVVRRLCKYLPSSSELSTAVTLDEKAEAGIAQNIDFVDVNAEPAPVASRTEQLAAGLPGAKAKAEPEVADPTMPPPNPPGSLGAAVWPVTEPEQQPEPVAEEPPKPTPIVGADVPVTAEELGALKAAYVNLSADKKGEFLARQGWKVFPRSHVQVTREKFEAAIGEFEAQPATT